VAFAELGDFIDQPIKTYSTGMVARLAFAVQVHVDPDILIVDETLSVGDAAFRAKAMSKIDEILNRGTTLLFVGHDMQMVRSFCNRAIYLNQGRLIAQGDPDEVTRRYIFDAHQYQMRRDCGSGEKIFKTRLVVGSEDIGVVEASIGQGHRHVTVDYGETINFRFVILVDVQMQNPRVFIDILDSNSIQVGGRVVSLSPEYLHRTVTLSARLRATLKRGVYRVRVRVADAPTLYAISLRWRHDDMLSFEVVSDSRENFLGLFPIPLETEWAPEQNG
jgi:lipopolysaccharide transport system ATP-binding protein